MKLHIGCGTIYLKEYVNIDAAPHHFTHEISKELLERNSTTLDKYYKYKFCEGPGICIADVKALADNLPYEDNTVDDIVMLHVLEHIPAQEVGKVLNEFNRVLKVKGRLYLGVPDVKETARLLAEAKTPEEEDWAIRLLHGTQRNKFSHHYCGYTERTLKKLLFQYGFTGFHLLPNINFYPAIHLEAFKELL